MLVPGQWSKMQVRRLGCPGMRMLESQDLIKAPLQNPEPELQVDDVVCSFNGKMMASGIAKNLLKGEGYSMKIYFLRVFSILQLGP